MPMPKKREDEKLGRPHSAADPADKVEFDGEINPPEPNEFWHPVALFAWEEWLKSPVTQFATGTDYAFAWAACEALDSAIQTGAAMKIQAAESMMRNALFTEQARRAARIEVTRKTPEPDAKVEDNVSEFRARRAKGA